MTDMNLKPILTDEDYEAALARVREIFAAEPGTPEGVELDTLVDLVEEYEDRHFPMGYPDPVEAIRFRMEQSNLGPDDLIPCIGSREKVSDVLSGRKEITEAMASSLHERLGIPLEVLTPERGGAV